MKTQMIGKFHTAARKLMKRFSSSGLVLLYHRVAEVDPDPWGLCVTPQHFDEHLEVLGKFTFPIHLQELAENLRDEKIQKRSVAVTFDDGYADNLSNAKPLLESHGISATVFLITDYLGKNDEFWWDELERCLLQPGILPETLTLEISGRSYEWDLQEMASYNEDEYRRDHNLKAWKGEVGTRHFLYHSIWQLLRSLPTEKQREVLDQIRTWAGTDFAARQTHRSLTLVDLSALAEGELIDIGSHTLTHPVLSQLHPDKQQEEILQGKFRLEEVLGCPINSFSYPYGGRGDYTSETVDMVRKAGFICACTSDPGVIRKGVDLFQLPRVEIHDWNGEEFKRFLFDWIDI